jgi:hypothetical protein
MSEQASAQAPANAQLHGAPLAVGKGALGTWASTTSLLAAGVDTPAAEEDAIDQPAAVDDGIDRSAAGDDAIDQPAAVDDGIGQPAVWDADRMASATTLETLAVGTSSGAWTAALAVGTRSALSSAHLVCSDATSPGGGSLAVVLVGRSISAPPRAPPPTVRISAASSRSQLESWGGPVLTRSEDDIPTTSWDGLSSQGHEHDKRANSAIIYNY